MKKYSKIKDLFFNKAIYAGDILTEEEKIQLLALDLTK